GENDEAMEGGGGREARPAAAASESLSEAEDRGPPCAYRKRGACTALGSGGRRNRIGSAIPTPSCIQHSGCAAQPSTHGAARAKLLALSRTLGSTPSAFRRTLG